MIIGTKSGFMVTGRIIRDPEEKVFDSGKSVVRTAVLYGQDTTQPKDENGRYPGLIVDVDIWGEYGTDCCWLQKGDHVIITGRKTEREYNGKVYKTLVADEVIPTAPEVWRLLGASGVAAARAAAAPLEDITAEDDDGELPF